MVEMILKNWIQVIALIAVIVLAAWGIVFAALRFISGAKNAGVDEIDAGPVRVDFSEDDKKDGVK